MRSQASDCLGPGGMFQSQGNARAEAQGRSGWQFKEQREHQCGCSRGEGRWGGNGGLRAPEGLLCHSKCAGRARGHFGSWSHMVGR